MATLPGGRGPRLGPDAVVDQDEAYDARRQRVPDANNWLLTNDDLYDDAVINVALPSIDTLHLSWVRTAPFTTLGKSMVIREARISVTALKLGALARAAIFLYIPSSRSCALLPGSQAYFTCSDIGLVKYTLPSRPELSAAARYLIGVAVNDTDPKFRGMAPATAARLVPGYTASMQANGFDSPLQLTRLTKDYTMRTISVAYISEEAAQCL